MDLSHVSYDPEDCLSQVLGQNIHSKVQRKKKKRVNKKYKTKEEGEEKKKETTKHRCSQSKSIFSYNYCK